MKKQIVLIVIGCLVAAQVYAAAATIALIIFTAKALGYSSLGISAIEAVAEVFDAKSHQKDIEKILEGQMDTIDKLTEERDALRVSDPKEYKRLGYGDQTRNLIDERLEIQNALYHMREGDYEVMRKRVTDEVVNIAKGYATGLVAQGATSRLVGAAAGTQGFKLTELGTEFFEALAAIGQGNYDLYKALMGSARELTPNERLFLESLSNSANDIVDFSIAKAVFRKVLYDNGYILPTGDEPISNEQEMKYMQQYLSNDPSLKEAYLQALKDKTGSGVSRDWDCEPQWTCDEWTKCLAGKQTRECMDVNICDSLYDQPALSRACETEKCTPDWKCGSWSGCSGGKQTRTCSDKNKCGVSTGKPAVSEGCAVSEREAAWQKVVEEYEQCLRDDPARKCLGLVDIATRNECVYQANISRTRNCEDILDAWHYR